MENQTYPSTDTKLNGNGKWNAAQKEAKNLTEDAQSAISQGIDQASEMASDYYRRAVESGSKFVSQASEQTSNFVRQYPIYAVLGGVAAGAILGALFARRRAE
jgi:ElaB/YqjD/DUF883 family membrane-anchored ribosome-binding protein